MKEELELLQRIAKEAKEVWDKGWLPLEAITLKNLLTDYIDMKSRTTQPAAEADAKLQEMADLGLELGRRLKEIARLAG